MNQKRFALAVFASLGIISASARDMLSLDENWRFLKADAPGAEQSAFDDSKWKSVNVPHDWSIEGPFAETNKTGGAGAFLPGGVAELDVGFGGEDGFAPQCPRIFDA